jgi:23S rRNA pseudouridine2605 synthase
MERLQKVIAEAGICSRRHAEQKILNGEVSVNGKIVTTLGTKVNTKDIICVNGQNIHKNAKVYYVMNKPRGVICTANDPYKRKTIFDIIPAAQKEERLFTVGRLDSDTKGVIVLTNDGDFMNALVGPKSGIEKEYLARISGMLSVKEIKSLSTGVMVNNKMTLPAIVNVVSKDNEHNSSLIKITVTEGSYHHVKEMFKAVGHDVKKLTRIRFGHLMIDNLEEGSLVRLSIKDVKILYDLAKKDRNIIKHYE